MRNVLSSRLKIHFKYNVKVKRIYILKKKFMKSIQGSTVDRNATDKEKLNPCPTLKDNDFLEDKRIIDLGFDQKQTFMERLKRDVNVKEKFFYFNK